MMPVEQFFKRLEVWTSREDLEWLTLLSDPTQPDCKEARKIELAKCASNPWYFLTHWCLTEDADNKDSPFQPFPNDIHLQVLVWAWWTTLRLLVPKSRQMTVTWLFCGLALWDSMFHQSRETFIQNKKEEDADANVRRTYFMWEHLPDWMKEWQPCQYTYCFMAFPVARSNITGIPAGADHIRSKTATMVMVDEAAFTEGMSEVLAAARPALGKHGRFAAVSSASPSYFKQLVFGEV